MSRRALLPYLVLVGVAMMSMGGIFTLLGEIRDELGFSETQLGLMVGLGFFTAFATQIALARFSDRGHSAAMIRAGLVGLVIALMMMGLADEYWQFILARMMLGLGVGALLPAVRRIVVVADADNVGANLGLLGSFDVGGFFVGPLVAGLLAHVAGFRAPFFIFAAITLALIPLVARMPKDSGATTQSRTVVRDLLAMPAMRAMMLVAMGWYAMIGIFEAVWSLLMTDRGAETWMIGVTISIIVAPMLILAPIGGRISQRRGPLRVARYGVLAVIPIVVAYGWVEHVWWMTAIAAFQGAIDSFVFPSTQVGAAMAANEELAASAQGLQGATLEVTAGTVAIIGGATYEAFGAKAVFVGAGVVMFLGVIAASFAARNLARDHPILVGSKLNVAPSPVAPG